MAIPNPDEVLNGAFAIDGSLSVRGIYADEIRLRKGATYSDFLTSVGTWTITRGREAGYNALERIAGPCATSTGAARRCEHGAEQYRRDRRSFSRDWAKTQNWALKDHFHDERYALVKHPHVKADITDWGTATCTTTSSAGPRDGCAKGHNGDADDAKARSKAGRREAALRAAG
eukprot:tig00000473_g1223.t1